MGCMFSQLAAKFAFFPPSPPTYQVKKGDNGKLTVVSSSSMPAPVADDTSLDVLLIDTKRGNKIVAFYLKNPYARLTVLYSHGNAADLGQLYDLFVQLKVNLRVNLMGSVNFIFFLYKTCSFTFSLIFWLKIIVTCTHLYFACLCWWVLSLLFAFCKYYVFHASFELYSVCMCVLFV